jgi:hypothetical protein
MTAITPQNAYRITKQSADDIIALPLVPIPAPTHDRNAICNPREDV